VSDDMTVIARRTVVGMCAQICEGREAEATLLQRDYLKIAMESGVSVPQALMMLAHAAIGAAVAASESDEERGVDWFRRVAANMAAVPSG
jgi:hypothetical protein